MYPLRSLLLIWCSSSAAIGLSHRSANSTGAPFINATAITASSITTGPTLASNILSLDASAETWSAQVLSTKITPTTLPTPAYLHSNNDYPTPTASLPASWSSNSTLNATLSALSVVSNASCTVQIPNASFGWWYPATFSHKMGTFTTSAGNFSRKASVTLLASTAIFDASSAIESDYVCTMSETYYSEWDATVTQCEDYTHKPTAASTSIAYRKAASVPLPSGNVVATSDLNLYDFWGLVQPSATATISAAPNVTITETSATPFVHFTAYEVAYKNRTETVQLSSAHAYPYRLEGVEESTVVSGLVPDEFLQQIPQSGCDAGLLQATVTVVIVVDLYYEYRPHINLFIVHFEIPARGWEDDKPFLVQDHGSRPPTFMTDWDIPGPSQPTALGRPQLRPDSAPATDVPKVQMSEASQTVGVIGKEPIILGASAVVIGSQTLRPGPAITVAGTPVSMLPSATALVIGGTTTLLPQPADRTARQTIGTIGTHPIVLGPSSVVIIGSQTIRPGTPITVDVDGGIPISFASEATALVIGSTTSLLPASNHIPPVPPVLTIGSSSFTPNAATQYILAPGQTLTPGGTAVLDGTPISLAPSASLIVIGSSTQLLSPPTTASAIVVDGMTFTALPPGPSNAPPIPRFKIGTTVLIAGGPAITLSSSNPDESGPLTTLSLAPSATALVVNGVPTRLPLLFATLPQHALPALILGAMTLTPAPGPGTQYRVDGQTLTAGGAVTVGGTTVELAEGATGVRWGSGGVWETGVLGGGDASVKSVDGGQGGGDASATATATGRREGGACRTGGGGRAWVVVLFVVLSLVV